MAVRVDRLGWDDKLKAYSEYLEKVFYLDLRSLALFRICLGILLLCDLLHRLPTLIDMYTSQGFFTRELSQQYFQARFGDGWQHNIWSLYWLSDHPLFVQALFLIAAIAAVFLILGKWTRIATVVSWLLLVSLHIRNPLVTTSGDFMFKMVLFWSMFLPLASKWSLDAKKNPPPASTTVCSIACIGFIIQLWIVYFFPGVAKWNHIWFSGDAMSYVLRLDIYIRELGRQMLNSPRLLATISWATLFAELVLIWTLFVSWRNSLFRMINLVVFAGFHIGIAMTMALGTFPWICMVAWLPLLPSVIWQRKQVQQPPTTTFDWNQLPISKMAAELFCLIAIGLVVLWNISNIKHPMTQALQFPLLKQIGYKLAIDQHFQMFGKPPSTNPWFIYEGQLVGGDKIDLWRKTKIDLERPESGLEVFPVFHWRKLHRNALHPSNEFIREPLLNHVVESWNRENPDLQVAKARLICFQEAIGPEYDGINLNSDVWAKFVDEEKSIGSIFDSLFKEEVGELPF